MLSFPLSGRRSQKACRNFSVRIRVPPSIVVSKDFKTASFAKRTATGGFAAMALARFFASSIRYSFADPLTTSPHCFASSAVIIEPVSTISIALYLPTARVRRCVPPAPGITPRLISGWPNFAHSDAIMMSMSSQARSRRRVQIR